MEELDSKNMLEKILVKERKKREVFERKVKYTC